MGPVDIPVLPTSVTLDDMTLLFEILNNIFSRGASKVATWFETGNVCFTSLTSNKNLPHCAQRKKAKRCPQL